MKTIWALGPLLAGDIYDSVPNEQGWAYSTVKTLVRRLVDKGWVSYRELGKSFLYRAAVPEEKAVRVVVREFAERVLDDSLGFAERSVVQEMTFARDS